MCLVSWLWAHAQFNFNISFLCSAINYIALLLNVAKKRVCAPVAHKIALQGGSEENKERWDESFSRARATRKKQGHRTPPTLAARFTRTGGASVVLTASVSDLCTLTLTSPSSCLCSGIYHSLDSVNSRPAFPEFELVFRKTVLPDQESLKSL